jgi:2-methylcitrate dehydratase PrpD
MRADQAKTFPARTKSFLADLRNQLVADDPALERQLRLTFLDTASTALGSLSKPQLIALQRQHARVSPGSLRLPGFVESLTPSGAALVLGASACWDELVEGYAPAHGRPALHIVPICMVLGQTIEAAMGALFLGYELGARIGEWYQVPLGEHVDGTWGTPAAALTAAALLDIGIENETAAISSALCQMSRSLFIALKEGASCRLLYPGLASARGIDLAIAAAAGFTSPKDIDTDPVLSKIGKGAIDLEPRNALAIHSSYIKIVPGARHIHYAAEAAKIWLKEHGEIIGLGQNNFKRLLSSTIELHTYPEACKYCGNPNPTNRIQAQFSLVFAVAATLRWGELKTDYFKDANLQDPILQGLIQQIKLVSISGEASRWAELVVAENSEIPLTARVDSLPGDPESPISTEDRLAKAQALLEPLMGQDDAEVLIEHWMEAPKASSLWPSLSPIRKD